ncbi:hypothetical protein ONS95_001076 [Cadophora gregata]|uniref:uncharacterized protein n=1 Tax=Cadophora gregata TaxID=51156 RepID=UPI0026DC96D6|nr:uncharacterized protein ONS95_001076 [Cadophora gregata]KAK0102125.1 hypothetical protein ONS96_006089 [Cadophora gregata f. sp. sojae]KAK0129141.1 hypothetical protein ONS95_001076 [Cadophora gregata]
MPPTDSYNTIISPGGSFFHSQFDELNTGTSLQSGADLNANTPRQQTLPKLNSNYVPFLERLDILRSTNLDTMASRPRASPGVSNR